MSVLRKKGGWSSVPNSFVRFKGVSADARMLAILLNSHSDGFRIRQDQIRANLRLGKVRMANAIAELSNLGVLVREVNKDENGAIIAGPWVWSLDLSVPLNPDPPVSEGRRVGGRVSRGSETGGSLEDQKEEDQKEEDHPQESGVTEEVKKTVPAKPVNKLTKEVLDAVWGAYWPRLLTVCGNQKVSPLGDKRAFAGICRKLDLPPELVASAALEYAKDNAKGASSAAYRKSLETILTDALFLTYLKTETPDAAPEYDAVSAEEAQQVAFLSQMSEATS